MEETLEQKQHFLRSQILDSGVDPESFMIFMGTVKQQGENINLQNWSIQQLRQVVQDFKISLQQEIDRAKDQLIRSRKSKQLMTSRIMESIEKKKQKVKYDRDNLWDYEIHTQQQCRKIDKLFTFKTEPEIDYKGWQMKKTGGIIFGIGSKNQLQITFITNFTTNKVVRKSQDVDWLRAVLCSRFVGSYVPPLEQTRYLQPEDKVNIMKRIKQIILFLNSLTNYEHLVQNRYFYVFIAEKDIKNFNSFKNYQSISKQADIGGIENLQGKFSVEISKRVLNFVKQSSDFARVGDQIYTNIEINMKKMMADLETLTKHSHYVANDFAKFHDRYNTLYEKCQFQKSQTGQKMGSILAFLNNLFTSVGNQFKKQITILRETVDDFIKFSQTQWSQFLVHQKKYSVELNNYLNFKLGLLRKKQRNFPDINAWQLEQKERFRMSRLNTAKIDKEQAFEMMHPKDNRTQQQMRIWQAYINDMYQRTFKILINEQEKQSLKHFSKLCNKMEKISEEQRNTYQKFRQIFGPYGKNQAKENEIKQ